LSKCDRRAQKLHFSVLQTEAILGDVWGLFPSKGMRGDPKLKGRH